MYNFISLLLHGSISFVVTFITLLSLTSFLARDIVFDNSCLFCALNILLCVVLPLLVSLPMLPLLLLLMSILILPVATTPLLLMIMLSLFIPPLSPQNHVWSCFSTGYCCPTGPAVTWRGLP